MNRSRNCGGGIYYIYGVVHDAQGQPLIGMRIHYTTGTVFPPDAVTEAKGYELTVGQSDAVWLVNVVDAAVMEIPGEGGGFSVVSRPTGMFANIHPGEFRLGYRRGF